MITISLHRLPMAMVPLVLVQALVQALVLPARQLMASDRDQRLVPGAEFQIPDRILMNRKPQERHSNVA